MSVMVRDVTVLGNPGKFVDAFKFEITVDCVKNLQDDVEWKLVYVGSPESDKYDQVLESIFVGPMLPGTNKFVFQAPAPEPDKIPADDLVGVTAVLLTASYKGKEFARIGYYVKVEYDSQEMRDNPPATPDLSKLVRNVLSDKPRITLFANDWDSAPSVAAAEAKKNEPTPM